MARRLGKGAESGKQSGASTDALRSADDPEFVAALKRLGITRRAQARELMEEVVKSQEYRSPYDLARETQTFLHLLGSWAMTSYGGLPANDLDREAWRTLKSILDLLLAFTNKARRAQKAALSVQLAEKLADVYRRMGEEPELGVEQEESLIRTAFAEHGMFFSDDAAGLTSYTGPGIPTVVPHDAMEEMTLDAQEISDPLWGVGPREAARKSLARTRLFKVSASQIQNRQERAWPTTLAHDAPFEFFGVRLTYPMLLDYLQAQVFSQPNPWTAFGVGRPDGKHHRVVNVQGFDDPGEGSVAAYKAFEDLKDGRAPTPDNKLEVWAYSDDSLDEVKPKKRE